MAQAAASVSLERPSRVSYPESEIDLSARDQSERANQVAQAGTGTTRQEEANKVGETLQTAGGRNRPASGPAGEEAGNAISAATRLLPQG